MKHILFAALVALTSSASAQITLEKSYSSYSNISVHNVENEGYKYLVVDFPNKRVLLFNADHTIWKTITPQIPSKLYNMSANYASTLLFDTDNGAEVVVTYYDTSAGLANGKQYTSVVNDDGTILITIPDCSFASVVKVDANWKFIANIYKTTPTAHYAPDVYSLPGQMLGVQKPGRPEDDFETSAYPNPAETTAAISYTLPAGLTAATVQLFNSNGVMLQSYPVSQNSGVILIDRTGYPAGMYHYTITAGGVKQSNNLIFQ